ncbi:hypothetical protein CEP53_010909 [Fusarium sp. AF-6]|nr:hypothetical protein CEP53_010909 [Fusarium sp. AF-6]
MTEKKNSATKLGSLYEALEIPQKGEIPCVGHLLIGDECTADQKDQRDDIESILHDIIYTTENGYTTGSDKVKDLLEELAEQLVCTDMVHNHLSPYGRGDYGKHKYVALLLGKKLRGWDEKLGEKDSDEDDEKATASAKNSIALRPKLTRETPMINESACVTPTKQRGRPSCNSRPSTPRTGQGLDAFDSLSVLSDALPSTPESAISPGVSEVFSPVSTASTPMSIPDSEIRPSRYRYSRGEEESPTRRPRSLKDGDFPDGAGKRSSREKIKQLEQGSQPGDQGEFEQQPIGKGEKTLLSLGLRNMEFSPTRSPADPVRDLLQRLHQVPGGTKLSPGWVYCFGEKTAPGYLKIGYKQYKDGDGNTVLSREDQNNEAQVMKRLSEWERACKHNIDYKFIFYMPCAAHMMEGLIHRTLHESKRKASCPNPDCVVQHREWFEISEMEARKAVEMWQQFSNLMPYAENGRLGDFWFNRTYKDIDSCKDTPIERWLRERWTDVIVPAALRCIELQKEKTQLAERRREVEERKKELELEIKDLTTEETKIQQELAELQSQH